MNSGDSSDGPHWPVNVNVSLRSGAMQVPGVVRIHPGVTALVGPNGSGKTQALRSIKRALEAAGVCHGSKRVHFLAAGRGSPLETYRAAINAPHQHDASSEAAVGHYTYSQVWYDYESVTGSLLALESRADLRLVVEARLQQLFDRSVELSWSQEGLKVRMLSMSGGASYSANVEASGILHIVALLAAIHNDQIGVLLIDEPEISLHPQHQAFLLEEISVVAGDPSKGKKIVVIATHSSSMLPLIRIGDLPRLVFFSAGGRAPSQISDNDDLLGNRKLTGLISRLGATHRLAMFADHILLVEGVSDEIIATQLSRQFNMRLTARNAQVLPITGKGDFVPVAKLFSLMGKSIAILADLDALADNNLLVNYVSSMPGGEAVAQAAGQPSIISMDADLRRDLARFISTNLASVDAALPSYTDWSNDAPVELVRKRVALALILNSPHAYGGEVAAEARGLQMRFDVLLNLLGQMGCYLLRRGAIENCFLQSWPGLGKPEAAAKEAEGFSSAAPAVLAANYASVIEALVGVAPRQSVREDRLLRPKLAAVLAAIFQSMDKSTSDEQLSAVARSTIGLESEIFGFVNRSTDAQLRVEVTILSPLFKRAGFPFCVSRNDNLSDVVAERLNDSADG